MQLNQMGKAILNMKNIFFKCHALNVVCFYSVTDKYLLYSSSGVTGLQPEVTGRESSEVKKDLWNSPTVAMATGVHSNQTLPAKSM